MAAVTAPCRTEAAILAKPPLVVACGRLVGCTFLGEQLHDVAAGTVIVAEAGAAFATIDGERLTPAEFVRRTPVPRPTFVAPPGRLDALLKAAKMF